LVQNIFNLIILSNLMCSRLDRPHAGVIAIINLKMEIQV